MNDYLSKSRSNIVKGIFILIVFLSHFQRYIQAAGGWTADPHLGQLMVAMFLFYFGYGIAESVRTKGEGYVRSMPRRRMLTTLLNFDIAVLVFVAVDLVVGVPIGLRRALLSLVCWESVGNSNWYIFTIIWCYFAAWLSFRFAKSTKACAVVFVLLTLGAIGLSCLRPTWWYDTMLVFGFGVFYSQYRGKIETMATRHFGKLLFGAIALFLVFRHGCRFLNWGVRSNAEAICFSLMVVLLTMKMPLRNSVLEWCGRNLFPIYIYQRLPMIVLSRIDPAGFGTSRAWFLYLPTCLAVTILIARFYPKWQIKLREK